MKIYRYKREWLEFVFIVIAGATIGVILFLIFVIISGSVENLPSVKDSLIPNLIVIFLIIVSLPIVNVLNVNKHIELYDDRIRLKKLAGGKTIPLSKIWKVSEIKLSVYSWLGTSPPNERMIVIRIRMFPWIIFFLKSNYEKAYEILAILKKVSRKNRAP